MIVTASAKASTLKKRESSNRVNSNVSDNDLKELDVLESEEDVNEDIYHTKVLKATWKTFNPLAAS